MSGYKRVNFYELCRLCATNQQKDKTHIFQEEGRKIQLQSKIQSCLSLKVCENDFLPKVVCSRCLRTLEQCSTFRKECYTSETMLSSYFNNFRYTEDFKKSGKVYIKDITPKVVSTETVTSSTMPSDSINSYAVNVIPNGCNLEENVPYYTLQLPSSIGPVQETKKDTKLTTPQPQIIYNLNSFKAVVSNGQVREGEAVNSNTEIITVAPLVDMETLFAHTTYKQKKNMKKIKDPKKNDESIKIESAQTDSTKYDDKLKRSKVTYQIKSSTEGRTFTNEQKNATSLINRVDSNVNTNASCDGGVSANNSVPNIPMMMHDYARTDFNAEPMPATNANLAVSAFNSAQTLSYSLADSSKVPQNVQTAASNDSLAQIFDLPVSSCELHELNETDQSAFDFATGAHDAQSSSDLGKQLKRHACDVCAKTFKRREHLHQHVKLHTGFRPFKCASCDKSFMRKEHLLRHMTSHSGLKNYSCNVCQRSFSRNDNLLKHKKIHSKQNSFTCEVCQKQFVMEHYYHAHKLTHDTDIKCNQINPAWGLLKAV